MTTLTKEVISMVRRLPDDATLDDIMHALYLRAKIERAEREVEEGKGIPHEVVRKRILQKWAK